MPPLPMASQERFAQGLAKGFSQVKAYIDAGYPKNSSNASTLARRPHVRARVDEIRAEARGRLEGIQAVREGTQQASALDTTINPTWLKVVLMKTIDKALEAGEFKEAIAAVELGARLIGAIQDPAPASKKKGGISRVGYVEPPKSTNPEAVPDLSELARRFADAVGVEPAGADEPDEEDAALPDEPDRVE